MTIDIAHGEHLTPTASAAGRKTFTAIEAGPGRRVFHFRPSLWDRWCQQLEVAVGELLPGQPVPLLKRRLELSREKALKLWAEKRHRADRPVPRCGRFQVRGSRGMALRPAAW